MRQQNRRGRGFFERNAPLLVGASITIGFAVTTLLGRYSSKAAFDTGADIARSLLTFFGMRLAPSPFWLLDWVGNCILTLAAIYFLSRLFRGDAIASTADAESESLERSSRQIGSVVSALDRLVFQSAARPVVVALTGGWGEGKTHFWKKLIAEKYGDLSPGYVSVFGAESLRVVRERVALAALSVPKPQGKLTRLVMKPFSALAEWFSSRTPAATVLKGVREFAKSAATSAGIPQEFWVELLEDVSLQKNWVICLDDIERRSEGVTLEDFLGYVSELRDRRGLKVVLIYNNKVLESEAEENQDYQVYEEKVIDRTVPFRLDLEDTVRLVPRHSGFDRLRPAQYRELFWRDEQLDATCQARGTFDEVGALQGEDHLVYRGRGDREESLQVGFGRGLACDAGVGVDEGQVLALFVGNADGLGLDHR